MPGFRWDVDVTGETADMRRQRRQKERAMSKQWVTLNKLVRPGESEREACERMGKEFAGKVGRWIGDHTASAREGRILGPFFGSYGIALEGEGWSGLSSKEEFCIKKHGTWAWIKLDQIEVECEVETQVVYKPVPADAPKVKFNLTAVNGLKQVFNVEGEYSAVELERKECVGHSVLVVKLWR